MGRARRINLGYVRVNLSVTLRSLNVKATLLRHPLVPGPLPLGEPPFGIGIAARVLRVKALGVLHFLVTLLRNENFSSTRRHFHHLSVVTLFLPTLFGHGAVYQSLNIV